MLSRTVIRRFFADAKLTSVIPLTVWKPSARVYGTPGRAVPDGNGRTLTAKPRSIDEYAFRGNAIESVGVELSELTRVRTANLRIIQNQIELQLRYIAHVGT